MDFNTYYYKLNKEYFTKLGGEGEKAKGQGHLKVICIYDVSGSMEPYWEWIARMHNQYISKKDCVVITFDTKIRVLKNKDVHLRDRLACYGGGGTCIPEAFMELDNYLDLLEKDVQATILFISDGRDNNLETLSVRLEKLRGGEKSRKVNFICMGITSNFPHFLSMNLRKQYHTGDENIPALFLVEHPGEKAFYNKFEGIREFLEYKEQVNILSPFSLYPWDGQSPNLAYENQWIISGSKDVAVEGGRWNQIKFEQEFSLEDISEIVKGWYQKIQMSVLGGGSNMNQITMKLFHTQIKIEQFLKYIEGKYKGLNLREVGQMKSGTVYEKALKNYFVQNGNRIIWIYDEIQNMVRSIGEGTFQQQNNEFEMAKKMNLGTLMGKYFQKILALEKVDVTVFQSFVEEFEEVCVKKVLPEISVYHKNNLANCSSKLLKLVLENKFLESLKLINNQFDLIELFPFYGYIAKAKRSDQSEKNCWEIQIQQIALQEENLSESLKFQSIVVKGNYKALFGEDFSEKNFGNFLVPLFNEEDFIIRPLLQTKLVKFIFSFLVSQNPDYFDKEAFQAICYANLEYLFLKPKILLRNSLIEQTLFSFDLVEQIEENEENKIFCEEIQNYLIYNENINFKKSLLFIIYLEWKKKITQNQTVDLIKIVLLRYFLLILPKYDIFQFIKINLKAEQIQSAEKQLIEFFEKNQHNKTFSDFFTIDDFSQEIIFQLVPIFSAGQQNQNSEFSIAKDKIFDYNILQNFDPNLIQTFCEEKLLLPLDSKFLIPLIFHTHFHQSKNPSQILQTPIIENLEEIQLLLIKSIQPHQFKFINGYLQIQQNLIAEFKQVFQQNHFEVIPLNEIEIKALSKQYDKPIIYKKDSYGTAILEKQHKNLNFYFSKKQLGVCDDDQSISYHPNTGLSGNMCLSKNCKFYLQVKHPNELEKHVQLWGKSLPPQFHKNVVRMITNKPTITPEQILPHLQKIYGADFPNSFGHSKDETLQYIQKIIKK